MAQSPRPSYLVSVRELSIPPKARSAFQQGQERLAKNDPEGSLPYFQRAVSEYAGYYEAYDRIGAANLKLWRVSEAKEAFRKSIAVSGGQYAHPLLALGAILDDYKEFGEAESVIRKGLDLDPNSWRGRYYLGSALLGLNRLAEAEESAQEALRQKKDFSEAYLLLADIHSHKGDYVSVVSDLDGYLRLAPDGSSSTGLKAFRESAQRTLLRSQSQTAFAHPQP